MGWDASELDEWVNGLEKLEKGLDLPRGPLEVNQTRYLDLARGVALQTLLAMRPDEVDPDEWFNQVKDFQELVMSGLTGNGLEIFYRGRMEKEEGRRNMTVITYNDVLAWVQTPVEEGGKDKTAIEANRGRSDQQIAYDVHQAIIQNRLGFEKKDYSRITDRLEQFVESRVLRGDLDEMLLAVLDAWWNALVPVMERDLADMVDDVLQGW
jgi:hypothetical protein